MKKLKSLVAIAVCLLSLFSCQKPEGTLPGSWMSSSGNGLIRCTVSGNLDYAVYDLNINLQSNGLEQLQLDKLELCYGLEGETQPFKTMTILKDALLKTNYHKSDTLWGLAPDKTYQYALLMADFFNEESSDTLRFQTLPVSAPVVILDTVYVQNGLMRCFGTIQYNWRAPVQMESVTPYMDGNLLEDPDLKVIDSHQLGADIIDQFCFSHELGDNVTCSFRVHAVNDWGVEAWSDPLEFSLFDIWVLTERVTVIGSNSVLVYGRPMKDGDGVTLNKLGFCVADHYNVGLDDQVYDANPGAMVWGQQYQLRITDLEPGTQYFFKSYMQINSDSGPIFFGAETPATTWEEVPVIMVEPDESQISTTSAFLQGYVGTLGQQQIDEYGFIWKQVDDPDPNNNEVSFALGHNSGHLACDNIDDYQHFSGMVTGLTSEGMYWFKAYVKFKINSEVSYSESWFVKTPSD